MSEQKHKPCPFCGSEDLAIGLGCFYVECKKCRCFGPSAKVEPFSLTQREIIIAMVWDAWDTRINREKVEELEKCPMCGESYFGDGSYLCMSCRIAWPGLEDDEN